MALNYGPGWGCYMADTNKTPPLREKESPTQNHDHCTANTDTSHTDLRLVKWWWNIYTELVAHHRWKSLTSDFWFFLLHWPHTVHEKKCTKNSLYCWLGSGIKSRALCCGLVSFSSGLRWWMRRSWSEMWVTHGSISRALRRYTREYAVAPPDNTEQVTVFPSLTIKNTR